MGNYEGDVFTVEQKEILKSTNIAFVRSGHEKVLDFCHPKIIIPEHYFPRHFVENRIPSHLKEDFMQQTYEIDKMINYLKYPTEEVDDFKYRIEMANYQETRIIRLLQIHPQVRYSGDEEIKRYW
jgi:hypothetical protein